MSRTKRIYNNPRLKKTQRCNLDDQSPWTAGIPYTKKSWICMGKCPVHRDHDNNYKIIRKRKKAELSRELKFYGVNYE